MHSRHRSPRPVLWVPTVVGALAAGLFVAPTAGARDLASPSIPATDQTRCLDDDLVFRPEPGTQPPAPPTLPPWTREGHTGTPSLGAGLTMGRPASWRSGAAAPAPPNPDPQTAGPQPLAVKHTVIEDDPEPKARLGKGPDGGLTLGLTTFDEPKITFDYGCTAGLWRAGITEATQITRQAGELPLGMFEATRYLPRLTSPNHCGMLLQMRTNLQEVSRDHSKAWRPKEAMFFYMIAAVDKHEDVHFDQYAGDLKEPFEALVDRTAKIVAGTRAKAEEQAAAARKTFIDAHTAAAKATAEHGRHTEFQQAEEAATGPVLKTVNQRMKTLGCP